MVMIRDLFLKIKNWNKCISHLRYNTKGKCAVIIEYKFWQMKSYSVSNHKIYLKQNDSEIEQQKYNYEMFRNMK